MARNKNIYDIAVQRKRMNSLFGSYGWPKSEADFSRFGRYQLTAANYIRNLQRYNNLTDRQRTIQEWRGNLGDPETDTIAGRMDGRKDVRQPAHVYMGQSWNAPYPSGSQQSGSSGVKALGGAG